ncbi:MAG: twin-arginine translocase TatA/TatE family subunit [Nitrospinales bacterium]
MMGIGFPELMIILVIIMIIFGAGKLPQIGSAFGNSIKNFKRSMKEAEEVPLESADATGADATSAAPEDAKQAGVKKKEEELIDEAAAEVEKNRIGTITTRHDGLVQEGDVFTESVKKTPFGMKSTDRGVSRDVL